MKQVRENGSAIIIALVMLVLISAIGLGLVLTTSLEPSMTASYEASLMTLYGAEAGIALAANELGGMSDWNPVLAGDVRSSFLVSNPDAHVVLPDGAEIDVRALTNEMNCGRSDGCSATQMDAYTADRPWGPNNPRWQLFGHGRLDQLLALQGSDPPCYVAVWVADDPAEQDGNPLRDSVFAGDGVRLPGAGLVVLRADGFGVRSARRSITVTLAQKRWAGDLRKPVVAWRELR